jgi:hypothetical protein
MSFFPALQLWAAVKYGFSKFSFVQANAWRDQTVTVTGPIP